MKDELLWQRGNTWYAVFRYNDENGRRQKFYKSCGVGNNKAKALKIARSWFRELQYTGTIEGKMTLSTPFEHRLPLFADYARAWFAAHAGANQNEKGSWKHSTIIGYESVLRCHVAKDLGHYRLDELTPLVIRQFVTDKIGKGYEAKTINNMLTIISGVYEYAEDEIEGLKNPVKKKHWQKITKKPKCPYTLNQVKALFRACRDYEPEIYPFAVLLFTSGLRFGEATVLKWSDIDFVEHEIHVNRAHYRQVEDTPKHGKIRTVPLHPFTAKVLLNYRGLRHLKDGLVFPPKLATNKRKARKFLSGHDLTPAWQRAQARAGLHRISFHEARHTFATILRNENQSAFRVMDLLGHESVTTTEGYAQKSEKATLAAAVNSMKFDDMDIASGEAR